MRKTWTNSVLSSTTRSLLTKNIVFKNPPSITNQWNSKTLNFKPATIHSSKTTNLNFRTNLTLKTSKNL